MTQLNLRSSAASASSAGALTGLGLDPVDRQRVALEELGQRALDDEPAVGQDPDPVADPLDVGQDVRREQHGDLAAQPGDQVEHVAPALGSRELTGSSRIATRGPWTSAPAIPRRCRMPPE